MRQRFGPKAVLREFKRQLPTWLDKGPQIPNLIHGALTRLNHMDDTQHALQQEIIALRNEMAEQRKQKRSQIQGGVAVITGLFVWWQAYALGMPESVGLAITALGVLSLILR